MLDPSPSERALAFATEAHRTQVRKGSGVPYVFHTVDVAKRLGDAGVEDEDVIIAGLLHDVVEDTPVTLEELSAKFGTRVAGFVNEMTFDESKESKHEYIAGFAQGTPEALAVKLMDRSANVSDYERERPEYAPKYARLALPLYAAVLAREAELASTFNARVAESAVREAKRLRNLSDLAG